MTTDFLPALANAKDYPSPRVRMLSTERATAGGNQRELPEPCVAVESMATARGLLSAIACCFKGKKVLLPAYHCPAMVEPFIYHQCGIEFYSVNEQLEFDPAELQSKLLTAELVIGVRFFGFDCQMDELKRLAVKTSTLLVEDLAHAAFVDQLYGDFAVTSLKKFYPVDGGAELFVANQDWVERVHQAADSLRLSPLRSLSLKVLAKINPQRKSFGFRYFSPLTSHAAVPAGDRHLLNHYEHQQSAQRRRENYRTLLEAFNELAIGIPLFQVLDADVVPYVFPLLLNEEKYFSLIRQAGIPLYRWEEIIESHCPVSLRLRKLLIQLPCHQDLTASDLDFMIGAVLKIDREQRV